jgi:hypothetical protein
MWHSWDWSRNGDDVVKYVNRPPAVSGEQPELPAPLENCLFSTLPAVWEYLTAENWPDGKKRTTSTLSLFVEQGKIKASLNDRALQQGLYATGTSLSDVLLSLEHAIVSGRADWRAWPRKK